MNYSNIKGIIFDLGSTLIEFESRSWEELSREGQQLAYDSIIDSDHHLPEFETFNERLEEIKSEYRAKALATLAEWRSIEAFEKLLRVLKVDDPVHQSRICMDKFYGCVREGIVLCEGAVETLKGFKKAGYRTGLISNTIFQRSDHEVDLDKFGLTPYIDFRLYSSDFGFRKPYPGIYEEGLKLIGLPADETLYVGDRYTEDVAGPQAAGMGAVLKFREGRDYPDPMPDGFDVINKISELLNLFGIK
jgi:putative hydrolase of the HAD superfamily